MGKKRKGIMVSLNTAVIIKLEPDFSEGNVSYNSDGTLNRAETKSILGPHSAVASKASILFQSKGWCPYFSWNHGSSNS